MAGETPLVSARAYEATRDAVLKLKQQCRVEETPSAALATPFATTERRMAQAMAAALDEHVVIVRTSGLRPGRENTLVDHIDVLRKHFTNALTSLRANYTDAEMDWATRVAAIESELAHEVDASSSLRASHVTELDQLTQRLEITHFEELENLTKLYDDKVVEIQAAADAQLAVVEAACNEKVGLVRAKAKSWKVAYEAKLKDAVTSKIDALKTQAELQLQAVLMQLDKEAQVLTSALQDARCQAKSLERQLAQANTRIQELEAAMPRSEVAICKLKAQVAGEAEAVEEQKAKYDALLATHRALQTQMVEEKTRLVQHHALQQGLLEEQLARAKQDEMERLHERVRHAMEMKAVVISQLEAAVLEAENRAALAEHALNQIHTEMMTSSRCDVLEAFPIDA
ncbi:hypothetical protein SDRG_13262 [Saprolegnia diclina VS20]|uniref:Uncharacterized protein n=1 Tax=Saprolegnia diclina (strain VS20) TaxID=1156394 RepID=T0Q301_SAPDV|nr:hypothetical protein SDRG_13262 [Saprolegnia diclina VS20]EQC28921.1 hypothetical protein SDRG_13262 [Saprolegnia diclina VS20]|eukprot:XP_008617560.1 hypothetical protein SDRG_13262 [Saprolegnia diclina VS20]